MKILFVTRKFPPSVGGLEMMAYELYSELQTRHTLKLVKWGGSNKWLPVVYPWLALRSVWWAILFKPDVVYMQDGMLAPLGALLRIVGRKKVVVSVHGLDITYKSSLYRRVVTWSLGQVQQVVAGSQWAYDEARKLLPHADRLSRALYGVSDTFFIDRPRAELLKELTAELPHTTGIHNKKIILTVGRLVERKGVAWFIDAVMPELVKNVPHVVYVVCGDGPMRQEIEAAVKKHGLEPQVLLLGRVSNTARNILYSTSDLFIMPNIAVEGDGEGFGLVSAEAGSCGTPAVGAALEGVQDAVIQGKNGYLVPSKDASGFMRIITSELQKPTLMRTQVRQYVLEHYSWAQVANRYEQAFTAALQAPPPA